MKDLVTRATEFAYKKHNNPSDRQRYGNAPYSKHIDDVAAYGEKYIHYIEEEARPDVRCGLRLHDTVEDTDTSPRLIEKIFNRRIAQIVLNVSNERGWGKKEVLFKTLPKIWRCKYSIFVKLADRLANTYNSKSGFDCKSESMYKKYKSMYPVFRYALKQPGQYEDMWKELDEMNDFHA